MSDGMSVVFELLALTLMVGAGVWLLVVIADQLKRIADSMEEEP